MCMSPLWLKGLVVSHSSHSAGMNSSSSTLPQINIEVERDPLQDDYPLLTALYELPCKFGGGKKKPKQSGSFMPESSNSKIPRNLDF